MSLFQQCPCRGFSLLLTVSYFANYYKILTVANLSSPFEVVYVCPSEQFAVTCRTNYTLLKWHIVVPHYQRSEQRYISSSLVVSYLAKLQINSSVLNISRSSAYEALPLVTTLLISYVNADLNQTLIYCSEVGHSYESRISATMIHVIKDGTFVY